MASSISYLSVHRVTLFSLYPDHALFVTYVCLLIIVFNHGCDCCVLLRLY
jgi:hypothetical protein